MKSFRKEYLFYFLPIIAAIVLVIFTLSFLPYSNLKNVEIEQVIGENRTGMKISNPTKNKIIFPEMEYSVYIDKIKIGESTVNETTIYPGESIIMDFAFDFHDNEETVKKVIESESIAYDGVFNMKVLGMKITIPFYFEKFSNGSSTTSIWGKSA